MIVYIPLFSWWPSKSDPDSTRNHSMAKFIAKWLKKVNMPLVNFFVGVFLAFYILTLAKILIYVEARPVGNMKIPSDSRNIWLERAKLVFSVTFVFMLVTGVVLPVLEYVKLAHVKQIEYYIILCPIQINLGLLLGSTLQRREYKRAAKMARLIPDDNAPPCGRVWEPVVAVNV